MPTINANGIEIYYEEAGASDAPVILLVMGLGTQMIAWPDDLIQGLVAKGFRVIHYDNRDVGLSQRMDGAPAGSLVWAMLASRFGLPVKTAYSLTDMARDGIGLLDALDIGQAHGGSFPRQGTEHDLHHVLQRQAGFARTAGGYPQTPDGAPAVQSDA
jgi:pimeloyl-ACP methyl ester carboxylesterase